jgi:hypothetical protein
MMDTVLNAILFIFLGASLVNAAILRYRMRAAKEQAGSGGGEDDEPRMSPKEAWRHSLFVTSFQGFLILYAGYKTFTGTWSWPVGTVAILVSVWLIRKPLSHVKQSRPVAARFSKDLHLAFPSAESVTPEYIASLLASDSVLKAINGDLVRTDQIGHKETWSLCLITSGQDRFDPGIFELGRQETLKRTLADRSFRSNIMGRVPVKRAAMLYSPTWFKYRLNNVLITADHSMRSHGLSTKTKTDEFTRIRELKIHPASARGKSTDLPQFLRESGFPLRQAYSDADPLTTERGGTIVSDGCKVMVIYPRYFTQRRVIDDDGELVYLGLNEDVEYGTKSGIEMRPSTSALLVKCVSYHGYVPIVRYRSFPYASDFMLPLLDTPMSANGWADLFIDTRGRAKLFVAKERTLAQWYEMLDELKQLLYFELARKNYHLLGLTRDPTHLNEYLVKKQAILAKHYHIDDFVLWGHSGGGLADPREAVAVAVDLRQSRADAMQTRQRRRLGFIQDESEAKLTRQRRGLGFIQDKPEPKQPQIRTYRYEQAGFEIDLPADWSPYDESSSLLESLGTKLYFGWTPHIDAAFRCGENETLNVVIEPMSPEPPPHLTQHMFNLAAPQMGYADCQFGRITVGGKPHTFVRYTLGRRVWCKKYLLVLDGRGYAITASCDDPSLFTQREKVWDAIASSLRVRKSPAEPR